MKNRSVDSFSWHLVFFEYDATVHIKRLGFELIFIRAQRDSNPRPAAPQAAILSKLNYEPQV